MLRDILINKACRKERGATTLEFAMIATLLLVFLFGIIEYTMIFVQEHYVANAAREAVRIGVRANNYNGYKGSVLPTASAYTTAGDRELVIKDSVAEYLNTFYDESASRVGTSVLTEDRDGDLATETDRVLIVTVEVDNLFTNITPRLLRAVDPASSAENPANIRFSAMMELEDPKEFDPANL